MAPRYERKPTRPWQECAHRRSRAPSTQRQQNPQATDFPIADYALVYSLIARTAERGI